MELKALKMYYKAAVIVPFYTMCFFVIAALVAGAMAELVLRAAIFCWW